MFHADSRFAIVKRYDNSPCFIGRSSPKAALYLISVYFYCALMSVKTLACFSEKAISRTVQIQVSLILQKIVAITLWRSTNTRSRRQIVDSPV